MILVEKMMEGFMKRHLNPKGKKLLSSTQEEAHKTMIEVLSKFLEPDKQNEFRENQREAIWEILQGRDVLAVMPTGGGKSLIYQYPSEFLKGIIIVISPLIALMKDQVDKLIEKGIPATYINSTLSASQRAEHLEGMVRGDFRLVYIAPERLRQYFFQEEVRHVEVSLLVVDEAHCISHWGYDFRPDYLHIAEFRQFIGNPTTIALTATATETVQTQIVQSLNLSNIYRVPGRFDRPNIKIEVRRIDSKSDPQRQKLAFLSELLKNDQGGGKTIIYTGTKRDAEKVAWFVRERLSLPAQHYHAGLNSEARDRIQDSFRIGRIPIIVATNAFGMGIDSPDVRLVIHHSIPGSLEAYYQEIGRAGRDNNLSDAVLLYYPQDRNLQEFFITNSLLSGDDLYRLWVALKSSIHYPEGWVNLDTLSTRCWFDEEGVKVRVGLQRLEEANIVEQVTYDGTDRLIRLVEVEEWDREAISKMLEEMEEHYKCREKQLENMINFAENNRLCRREQILTYFGETETSVSPNNCCDVCYEKKGAARKSLKYNKPIKLYSERSQELPPTIPRWQRK